MRAPAPGIAEPRWTECFGDDGFRRVAVARIRAAADAAIAARGRFLLVLAGGDTPKALYEDLAAQRCDWQHWRLFLSDERCLPDGDPARNETMVRHTWLDPAGIAADRLTAPHGTDATAAALGYARAIEAIGPFDLVLLGVGEDGHTASLFPGLPPGDSDNAPAALPVHDAPKPPPERVTLSTRRLCEAHHVLFMAKGAGKRVALDRWRAGEPLPAARIGGRISTAILWTHS